MAVWHNHCCLAHCGNMNSQCLDTWRKEIYWNINPMLYLLTWFHYLKHKQVSGFISYEYFSGN